MMKIPAKMRVGDTFLNFVRVACQREHMGNVDHIRDGFQMFFLNIIVR